MKIIVYSLILILISGTNASDIQTDFGTEVGEVYNWGLDYQIENGQGANFLSESINGSIQAEIVLVNHSSVVANIITSYNSYEEDFENTGYLNYLKINGSFVISISKTYQNLLYIPYEQNLPLIWPVNEEYWSELESQLVDEETYGTSAIYEISKDENYITLVEERNDTPVDGCLCNVSIKLDPQTGVLQELVMKSTGYFVSNPPHYEKIRIYQTNDPINWNEHTNPVQIPGFMIPIVFSSLVIYSKFKKY